MITVGDTEGLSLPSSAASEVLSTPWVGGQYTFVGGQADPPFE
ncbi:hypothetical protein [Mycolicibacterium sp. S2-37]|nr:hypothetical protein [Mycolicibacterium sp. S2-37]